MGKSKDLPEVELVFRDELDSSRDLGARGGGMGSGGEFIFVDKE